MNEDEDWNVVHRFCRVMKNKPDKIVWFLLSQRYGYLNESFI